MYRGSHLVKFVLIVTGTENLVEEKIEFYHLLVTHPFLFNFRRQKEYVP